MATFTPNLNLRKPERAVDQVSVDTDLNANWDKVDVSVVRVPKVSGHYLINVAGHSALVATSGQLCLAPVYLEEAIAINEIGAEVTVSAAGSSVRAAIYGSDANGRPSSLVVESGTLDSTTIGKKTAVVSATIPRGISWWGLVGQGGSPTMRAATTQSALRPHVMDYDATTFLAVWPLQTGVTGALPSPFARNSTTSNTFCVRVRIA